MLLSHKNGNLLIFIIYIAIECLLSYAYARDLESWIHLSWNGLSSPTPLQ